MKTNNSAYFLFQSTLRQESKEGQIMQATSSNALDLRSVSPVHLLLARMSCVSCEMEINNYTAMHF